MVGGDLRGAKKGSFAGVSGSRSGSRNGGTSKIISCSHTQLKNVVSIGKSGENQGETFGINLNIEVMEPKITKTSGKHKAGTLSKPYS